MPSDGDGTVIVRNLATGSEQRLPTGRRAETVARTEESPTGPPAAPTPTPGGPVGGLQFTPDSKRLLIPLAPTRMAIEQARTEKKKADEMPRAVLAVLDLATGTLTDRIEKIQSFSVRGEGAGFLIYRKEPRPEDAAKGAGEAAESTPQPRTPGGGRRPGPGGGRFGGGAAATGARSAVASDLVVRNLADGTEVTFADVTEHVVTRDNRQIVYVVQSKKADQNGVYVATLGSPSPGVAVKSGPGRYSRLTWDERQTRLAFFVSELPPAPLETMGAKDKGSSAATASSAPAAAPVRVFVWDRAARPQITLNPMGAAISAVVATTAGPSNRADDVLGPNPQGLKPGWRVADRGGLRFSDDGRILEVATAPVPERPTIDPTPVGPAAAVTGAAGRFGPNPRAAEDRVDLDIWHWKDPLVQPMQRVRSAADRNRTYRAALFLDSRQFRQLADEDTDVTVPEHGDWGLASSDLRFRGQNWLGMNLPKDYALFNVRSGEKKPILRGQESAIYRSPKGKYLVAFIDNHWHGIAVPDGKSVNLTGKLGVNFFNEEYDSPSTTPAYGVVGWTADERFVLVNDRYDILKLAADGTSAENLTKVGRGLQTRFRLIRLADADEGPDRGIDLSKPMLLAAENLPTRDTGFYRLEPGGSPKLLVMGARRYGSSGGPGGAAVVKAKHADVYLFQVSTFQDHPDYFVADRDFREIKRITDINPRVREFNWGKAELVHYKNADGRPLSGVLIKPEDFDPTKKYPMIVYIYERLSQNLHNFSLPRAGTSINPTYYASNGYLVLMPDIAYTIGSPGQSALKCVLPAIQAVVDRGCVNESAIGIQGHSWGGYQIAYMVTQTNRFKAAAAGAPVANMTSAYGGIRWGTGMPRQFQYEKTQSRIGKSLWEAPMRYIENSPIFMADRVQTPLLMLHNDQDDAVPWYQGIEYYLALRRLGKEVYLLNYNGELHGLRRKASQRDYTLRMQQFFDHHLKGAPAPEWMARGVPYNEREKEKEQWKKLFGAEKK
jgi:dienelactone hydrolase